MRSNKSEKKKQQFEFLQSGRKKIREADKLRMNESQKLKLLTPQEKDAFDYFRGTGFYQSHQDVSRPPNIFDTRDTFLEKMQNFEMRNKFLNTYNNQK